MKKFLTLALSVFLLCALAAPGQAMTVACVNCSDNWTQQMERITQRYGAGQLSLDLMLSELDNMARLIFNEQR